MTHDIRNILVLSENAALSESIKGALSKSGQTKISSEASTVSGMNGKAADLAFGHDLIIFEANPDDEAELHAISELSSGRRAGTVFIAFTDGDVSIAKARRLHSVGVDDVLPTTISTEELASVIQSNLTATLQKQTQSTDGSANDGAIIAIAQARGGIGSTTVAVNLARSLQSQRVSFRRHRSHRVALVDLDLQFGNANVFMDIEDNGGFLKLMESNDIPDAKYMQSIMQKHRSGVDVLSAPLPIAPLNALRSDAAGSMLDVLRAEYDYVVVDLPRAMVDWLEPVLSRAARLAIVTDTSVPCIRQSKRMLDFYREANVGLQVDLIVNREKKPIVRSQHLKEAEAALESRFAHWIPDNPRVARKAVDLGKPITDLFPRSDISKAFRSLASSTFAALPAATMTTR